MEFCTPPDVVEINEGKKKDRLNSQSTDLSVTDKTDGLHKAFGKGNLSLPELKDTLRERPICTDLL